MVDRKVPKSRSLSSRSRDREGELRVGLEQIGGVTGATDPGNELVARIGGRGRPHEGRARAPVLDDIPGAPVPEPPLELIRACAATARGGEGDRGAYGSGRDTVGGDGERGRPDWEGEALVVLEQIDGVAGAANPGNELMRGVRHGGAPHEGRARSPDVHTSELQSRLQLPLRLLLE